MAGIEEEKYDDLLKEFIQHREAIKKMIVELESIMESVEKILPKTLDVRYMRFFEDKIKAITAFFGSLLDMRKEIVKSVKDEIELRKKLGGNDPALDVEKLLDIRAFASKVSDFQREKEKLVQSREVKEIALEEIKEENLKEVKNG
jgi:hypothetical protein